MLIKIFEKERNKFTVACNHKYKETYSINSVQSSLKSHPLWVTLNLKLKSGSKSSIFKFYSFIFLIVVFKIFKLFLYL